MNDSRMGREDKKIELALMLEAKYLEMQITHKHMSDNKTFA